MKVRAVEGKIVLPVREEVIFDRYPIESFLRKMYQKGEDLVLLQIAGHGGILVFLHPNFLQEFKKEHRVNFLGWDILSPDWGKKGFALNENSGYLVESSEEDDVLKKSGYRVMMANMDLNTIFAKFRKIRRETVIPFSFFLPLLPSASREEEVDAIEIEI